MSKPRLLDLYCGAGGSAMGYSRAGFEVVGIDHIPQPNYPFEFRQGDALSVDLFSAGTFHVIHASPPCQRYIRGGLATGDHPDLLDETRDLLKLIGLPYIIENVPGAPMRADLMLCGSMFGLPIRRHRWFETNVPVSPFTLSCDHSKPVVGVYGHPHGESGAWKGMLPGSLESWSEALGIDWMTAPELALAIPPAFTEFVGSAVLAALQQEAV
jgi:DNA (cytosine-5)-methyltransferase 1